MEANGRRESIGEEEESSDIDECRAGRRDEAKFEELDVAVDTFIRHSELKTESQYAQEVPFIRAYS